MNPRSKLVGEGGSFLKSQRRNCPVSLPDGQTLIVGRPGESSHCGFERSCKVRRHMGQRRPEQQHSVSIRRSNVIASGLKLQLR